MIFEEFIEIIEEKKENRPIWFELCSEENVSEIDILNVEKIYNINLPEEYKLFLRKYGGGFFAFTTVYTCNPNSEFYIVNKNLVDSVRHNNFIAISDNGVGDLYGFLINKDECENKISIYLHDEKRIQPTNYSSFYDYILAVGLKMN